jgi:hypothetical protein
MKTKKEHLAMLQTNLETLLFSTKYVTTNLVTYYRFLNTDPVPEFLPSVA